MNRKELETTISLTSYFILAALVALALSGCGRKSQSDPNLNKEESQKACGYAFTLEPSWTVLQGQMKSLSGNWRDDSGTGFTTVNENGSNLYQKNGFVFDFLKNVYGEMLVRYSSTNPLLLDSFVMGKEGFNALQISVPLKSFGDGTYRAVQAFKMDVEPGYNTCRTFAYKIVNGSTIVITPGKNHFVTAGDVPSIADYLKEISNPDQYKYTRQAN